MGNHEPCLFFSGTFCFIIFLLTVGSTVERVPDVSSLFARTVLQSEVKMFKSFSLIAATHCFCRQEGDFSVGSCKTPLETELVRDAAVTCAEGFAFCGTLSPDKHLAELYRSLPSAADRRQTRFPALLPCNFGLLSPAGRRSQPSALRRRRSPAFPAADGTRPGALAAGNGAKKKNPKVAAGRLRSRSFSPSGPTVLTGGGCEASPGNGEMAAGEREGRDYLERHRIPELLHRLSALLLYHQPGAAPPRGQGGIWGEKKEIWGL